MKTWTLALALPLSACAAARDEARYEALRAELDAPPPKEESPLDGDVLDRGALIRAVLAQNPSITAAREAWRAALARFPEVTALDDPMASYMVAPLSIVSDVRFGQEIMLTQKLPFPGKLAFRGAAALAEADAMRGDVEATKLELALMASTLHADDYANARALEINEEHAALLGVIRGALQARFESGDTTLQAPLGAEMELANVERERVKLLAERDVIRARINALLHRPPDAALPPAPKELAASDMGDVDNATLLDEAIAKRPELGSVRARIKAAQAEIAAAKAESFPDFSVTALYTSMFAELQHQFMIGGSVEIPIQLGRRAAAVEQAESRRRREDAELLARIDAVRAEVDSELTRLKEAREVVRIYDDRTIPLAEAVVEAAQAGAQTNRTSFLELLEAERALRNAKLARAEAAAKLEQQIARLERALGRLPEGDES